MWRGEPGGHRGLEQRVGFGGRAQLRAAQIVRATLQQREGERHRAVLRDRRKVLLHELALQRDRRRRHDDLEPRRDRGGEVGEALARTGRCLGDEMMTFGDRGDPRRSRARADPRDARRRIRPRSRRAARADRLATIDALGGQFATLVPTLLRTRDGFGCCRCDTSRAGVMCAAEFVARECQQSLFRRGAHSQWSRQLQDPRCALDPLDDPVGELRARRSDQARRR